ncbi:hypothetical protein BYT27DRAFT_6743004 [Phlegmacium glaucopus]|nr:hypothetical protein BYT27DRAFT_6743004 [Phlegmacium glaucopus]
MFANSPTCQSGEALYLVPRGRYLVTSGPNCLGVWDLRYVSDGDIISDGKPTTMWAATVNYIRDFVVQPTADGLGIRILTYSPPLYLFSSS